LSPIFDPHPNPLPFRQAQGWQEKVRVRGQIRQNQKMYGNETLNSERKKKMKKLYFSILMMLVALHQAILK